MKNFDSYPAFNAAYPLLGPRLHTLHCESCKPAGVSLTITYEGTDTDGTGFVNVTCQYAGKRFKVTVRNGVIRAFGRTQSMRRPTVMHLSGGRRSTYSDETLLK